VTIGPIRRHLERAEAVVSLLVNCAFSMDSKPTSLC
jgi:hypothetical protein